MGKNQKFIEKIEAFFANNGKRLDRKKTTKLINILSDERLERNKSAILYKIKGLALFRGFGFKNRYNEAILNFRKALELDPNDASVYAELAKTLRITGKLQESLTNCNTALTLNPKEPLYYIERARIFRRLHKRVAFNKDLQKVVRINPKDPRGYYLRSDFWRFWRLGKGREKSFKDLATAVKLDQQANARSHVRLGNYYLDKKKYELAIEHYNKATDKDHSIDLWEMDMFVYIFNALSVVNNRKRKKIYEVCAPAMKMIETIRTYLDTYDYDGSCIVHFTKLSVADILVSNDSNRLRFYHASYMNDPEEGRILLEIFGDPGILDAFSQAEMTIESNFYLGSYLPVQNADELVMWRTYGKDEQDSEARGCSLVIKREFFEEKAAIDNPAGSAGQDSKADQPNKGKTSEKVKEKQPRVRFDTSLHKVIYYDKKTKKILGENGKELKHELTKLRNQLRKILLCKEEKLPKESKLNNALDNIVYYLTTELRYYFKSADYSYENEERVVLSVPPRSPLVKIEDTTVLPKRLYVEAKNSIRKHIKKIILGPRVIHPERWAYLKVKMIKEDYDIELVKSNCKFQ